MELLEVLMSVFLFALLHPMFWFVILLTIIQYRRISGMEQKLFGRNINNVWRQVLSSLGLGALGGFAASVVLLLLGLSLEQIGLYFIWPVALILLLIHPRFLCFAYAGGLVGVAVLLAQAAARLFPGFAGSLIGGALLQVHLPAVLVLIGLLHLIEALLIYLGGHHGFTPVYYKCAAGEVVGGFSLQRFWPMPLVALMVTVVLQSDITGISMPDWWPLLKPSLQPGAGESLQYLAVPVAAGLGYADLALSSTPQEKSLFSARYLALYSVVLLAVALAAEYYPPLVIPGVILAPLGHELVIVYGNKREMSRDPLYRDDARGIKVMMVLPGSAAEQAGLKQGDIIQKVNGFPVRNLTELLARIEDSYFMLLLEGLRMEKDFSVVFKKGKSGPSLAPDDYTKAAFMAPDYATLHRSAALGLIAVPPRHSRLYVEKRRPRPLGWLRRIIKGKNSA